MSTEAELEEAASSVKAMVREELEKSTAALEEGINNKLEAAITKALKAQATDIAKRKRSAEIDFQKTGCKKRFKANEEIHEELEDAMTALDNGNLEDAKEKLTAGTKLLTKQQKLIRIADREDDGWEVVKHYDDDDLADDSDDEKLLKKARKAAAETKKKAKDLQQRKNSRSRFRGGSYSGYRGGYGGRGSDNYNDRRPYEYYRPSSTKVCWSCGRSGHIQSECRQRRPERR